MDKKSEKYMNIPRFSVQPSCTKVLILSACVFFFFQSCHTIPQYPIRVNHQLWVACTYVYGICRTWTHNSFGIGPSIGLSFYGLLHMFCNQAVLYDALNTNEKVMMHFMCYLSCVSVCCGELCARVCGLCAKEDCLWVIAVIFEQHGVHTLHSQKQKQKR